MRQKGIFITVEGMDGSGKTTQIGRMVEYLRLKGFEVVLTREPGGTFISEKIREILLDAKNNSMSSMCELLLYSSSRAQHIDELIRPALNEGKVVICDRFIDSSVAYQGYGRGLDKELIHKLNDIAINNIYPDITLFFDLSPETALERRIKSTKADRIEQEKLEFHMKVYEGYKELMKMNSQRIKCIDASKSIDGVFEEVKNLLDDYISKS